jgi:hypothetical protein
LEPGQVTVVTTVPHDKKQLTDTVTWDVPDVLPPPKALPTPPDPTKEPGF